MSLLLIRDSNILLYKLSFTHDSIFLMFLLSLVFWIVLRYFDREVIAITSVIARDDQKGKVKPLPVFKLVSF